MSNTVVYQWLTSDDFLIRAVYPHARVIEATVTDTVEQIASQLPGDLATFVFHLNCTQTGRFPLCRTDLVGELRRRGVTVLNARATDISKRNLQRICAGLGLRTTAAPPDGDPGEIVIVKTNLNFGGDSEWALSQEERAMLGIAKGTELIWKSHQYMILPRREVRQEWWTDENLICERFITNQDNRCYRAYVFRGRAVVCALINPHEIKKMDASTLEHAWFTSVEEEESSDDGPAPLRRDLSRFIREFGLDFGTVDFVEDDCRQPYLIDVNTTPGYRVSIPGLLEYFQGVRISQK